MISINDFCERHNACQEGREWALANCKTMDDVWRTIKPDWLLWIATRKGVIDDRTLRLFACWSARQVWHLLTDKRSRNAVEVAERFANGEVTADELKAAGGAASAASAAAWASWAAMDAARDAAWDAAREAAGDAAWAAACAARDAACEAAREAAREKQAEWLRANAKPNFELEVME